jgi:hypothetical protein
MKTLMIHDVRREYFDLNLSSYRLTLDDGLFSQYYYYPLLSRQADRLTYFITTSFVQSGSARNRFVGDWISVSGSPAYMHKTVVEKEFSHFMNLAEIQFLAQQENVRIGAHSHFHDVIPTRTHPHKPKALSRWKRERFHNDPAIDQKHLSIRSRLAFQGFDLEKGHLRRRSESEWEDYIRTDTEHCLAWFEANLGFAPDSYCFPFNEYSDKLIFLLKTFGFRRFYAARAHDRPEIFERVDIDSLI